MSLIQYIHYHTTVRVKPASLTLSQIPGLSCPSDILISNIVLIFGWLTLINLHLLYNFLVRPVSISFRYTYSVLLLVASFFQLNLSKLTSDSSLLSLQIAVYGVYGV